MYIRVVRTARVKIYSLSFFLANVSLIFFLSLLHFFLKQIFVSFSCLLCRRYDLIIYLPLTRKAKNDVMFFKK